jgi:hypothetical protein
LISPRSWTWGFVVARTNSMAACHIRAIARRTAGRECPRLTTADHWTPRCPRIARRPCRCRAVTDRGITPPLLARSWARCHFPPRRRGRGGLHRRACGEQAGNIPASARSSGPGSRSAPAPALVAGDTSGKGPQRPRARSDERARFQIRRRSR